MSTQVLFGSSLVLSLAADSSHTPARRMPCCRYIGIRCAFVDFMPLGASGPEYKLSFPRQQLTTPAPPRHGFSPSCCVCCCTGCCSCRWPLHASSATSSRCRASSTSRACCAVAAADSNGSTSEGQQLGAWTTSCSMDMHSTAQHGISTLYGNVAQHIATWHQHSISRHGMAQPTQPTGCLLR